MGSIASRNILHPRDETEILSVVINIQLQILPVPIVHHLVGTPCNLIIFNQRDSNSDTNASIAIPKRNLHPKQINEEEQINAIEYTARRKKIKKS